MGGAQGLTDIRITDWGSTMASHSPPVITQNPCTHTHMHHLSPPLMPSSLLMFPPSPPPTLSSQLLSLSGVLASLFAHQAFASCLLKQQQQQQQQPSGVAARGSPLSTTTVTSDAARVKAPAHSQSHSHMSGNRTCEGAGAAPSSSIRQQQQEECGRGGLPLLKHHTIADVSHHVGPTPSPSPSRFPTPSPSPSRFPTPFSPHSSPQRAVLESSQQQQQQQQQKLDLSSACPPSLCCSLALLCCHAVARLRMCGERDKERVAV